MHWYYACVTLKITFTIIRLFRSHFIVTSSSYYCHGNPMSSSHYSHTIVTLVSYYRPTSPPNRYTIATPQSCSTNLQHIQSQGPRRDLKSGGAKLQCKKITTSQHDELPLKTNAIKTINLACANCTFN